MFPPNNWIFDLVPIPLATVAQRVLREGPFSQAGMLLTAANEHNGPVGFFQVPGDQDTIILVTYPAILN